MRNSIQAVLSLLSISLIFFVSCDKSERVQNGETLNLETAKIISHLPPEIIEPGAALKIRFVEPIIGKKEIGISALEDVFEFEPEIDGDLSWQDEQTLVFKPVSNLKTHQSYKGKLDLEKVDAQKFSAIDPILFEFQVAGQELTAFSGEFKLVEKGNPKKVYYSGVIDFALNVDVKMVEAALTLKNGTKQIDLKITPGKGSRQVGFRSAQLVRNNSGKNFVIQLANDDLELPTTFIKEIKLPALKNLQVNNISKDEGGSQPRVRIEFSDELDSEQNIDGFISVSPAIDFSFRKMGKTVLINAPFELGKSYTFEIRSGILSRWATKLTTDFKEKITFEDLLPEIKFSQSGIILPSSNLQKIAFMTVNVRKVNVNIIQVFESNIGQFLQSGNLGGEKDRKRDFYNSNRVGVTLKSQTLEIGDTKNRWLQHELDLSKLIKPDMKGLLLLSLQFEREDMIYEQKAGDEYSTYRNRGRGRYGDPGSYYYLRNKGRIFKPLILSDIGLTYKKLEGKAIVYATNLLNSGPLRNVKVRLRTYQNQVLAERITNNRGIAEFEQVDKQVFYIEGEHDGQRSIIKVNEMAWNISNFDIRGQQSKKGGISAFIYTERGVYRPGDTVNVSIIVRNKSGSFPDNHPVTMKVKNPLGQLVVSKTLNSARDGFYSFRFNTSPQDPTGSYQARFSTGSATFSHIVKIETVVPERIKIKLETVPEKLTFVQRDLSLKIQANYLFGNPASNLEANVEVTIREVATNFVKYPGFIFKSALSQFRQIDQNISRRSLDAEGHLNINWRLPDLSKAPGRLRARFNVKVFEKGGRFAQQDVFIPIEPFKYLVGAKKPALKWGYAQIGKELEIPVILVDQSGKSVPGKPLTYKIYRNERHWWWEYNSRDQYRMRYKTDSNTDLKKEGQLISGTMPTILKFKPAERGQYLIEILDDSPAGHVTSFFINAYHWGSSPDQQKNAGTLVLKSDKEKYAPGDEAVVTFPVPEKGSVLVTVEKGKDVLNSNWYTLPVENNEMSIKVPVSESMLPTAYVSVSVIQPHSETKNDRPIRTYGVIPLNVSDPATEQEIFIRMSDELETGKPFEVEIQTADKSQVQFTLAIVDEGLLQLTRFKTPAPWKYFYSKERLGVLTYDLYGHIIGANHGDIFRTFSIGGEMMDLELRANQNEDEKTAKRFKAVSMFEGPFETDRNGHAKVSFTMPDYIGAVRVMVVAANNARYGHTEKTVPVTSDLMLMPTLPRVLGPEDEITVPLTVFAMKENLGDTKVTLSVDGPIEIIGQSSHKMRFTKPEERDVLFKIRAKAGIGIATIKITAKSATATAEYKTEIEVRTSSGMEYITKEETLKPGGKIKMNIPGQGVAGSNEAVLTIRRNKDLNFGKRLYRLIRYPYGCIEQTTSSVFPQLYLEKFIPKSSLAKKDIDDNINDGIKRLRKFIIPSGAFGYWPGARSVNLWGTNYAGHFLVEAKRKGYHVPDDLMNGWLKFQKSQALLTTGDLMTRVYRLYLLALAGQPAMGPMNLIRESSLPALKDVERWMLASAYKLAGIEREANMILKSTGSVVKLYREFAGTYGSSDRDKAIILDQMVFFENYDKANKLVDELAAVLKSKSWLSTQESAFILLAMGKYLNATGNDDETAIIGKVTLPNGTKVAFDFKGESFDLPLKQFGGDAIIEMDKSSKAKYSFVVLNWNGQPLKSTQKNESKNLELDVQWLDENGLVFDPANVKQGSSFWGRFSVKVQNKRLNIEELALTQILPAGWEIENLRLNQSDLPSWTRGYKFKKAEYEDIRDDRISWFFDLRGYEGTKDFLVKINAVTVGEFFLPGTTFGAMYDNDYRATKAGKKVVVTER